MTSAPLADTPTVMPVGANKPLFALTIPNEGAAAVPAKSNNDAIPPTDVEAFVTFVPSLKTTALCPCGKTNVEPVAGFLIVNE
jgi:hypothetical protein